MKQSILSFFLTLLVSFQGIGLVQGQTITFSDTTQLVKQVPILNNKLLMNFPSSAVLSPRVADIMAADPNENRETRIIVEKEQMKLVFFAQELYAFGGKDLFKDISAEIQPEFDFRRKKLVENDSLLAIISTPFLFDTSSAAILINSLLVRSPDNTVIRIDAYINPEAMGLKDEYSKLTEKIFSTIVNGTRKTLLNEREETYTVFGTPSKLVFKIPKNYALTIDEKYDFGVFRFRKYKSSILDTTYTSVTIYTGRHPDLFHKDYGYVAENANKVKGKYLQQEIEWFYFKDDSQSFYLKEQIIPATTIQEGMVFHIAVLSNKKGLVDEMDKIVESVKLIK